MDAIVLAGGKSKDDALNSLTGGRLKSMLPIAGKPMVQWVLDALSQSKSVETVALIGIHDTSSLKCSKPLITLPDEGSLIGNMQQGSMVLNKIHPDQSHVLSISADLPTITAKIVDDMAAIFSKCEVDIYYSVVERSVIEKRFPGSKRTFIKIKGEEFCGGDLNSFSKQAMLAPDGLWQDLIKTRKNPLKQAALIGIDSLLLLLLGVIDLDQVAARVCKRLGITGKALRVPYAEIGMDVDKPFQFEMVQADLLR